MEKIKCECCNYEKDRAEFDNNLFVDSYENLCDECNDSLRFGLRINFAPTQQ